MNGLSDTRNTMESQLGPGQHEMGAAMRAVAQDRIEPRAMKWRDGPFPCENLRHPAKIGMTGTAIPEEDHRMEMF